MGTPYWVRVSAINSAGVGPTTLAVPIEHGVGNSLAPRAPPGPPESVVVRSVGFGCSLGVSIFGLWRIC